LESHRVIIAGSRNIFLSPYSIFDIVATAGYSVDKEHAKRNKKNHIGEVVSGNAKGVDTSGEYFAFNYNVPMEVFPAEWDKHGRSAGPIRNKQMADYADALVLIWDGRSTGSANMKSTMLALDKPVYEVVFKGWN
jgi:hypothetical protein